MLSTKVKLHQNVVWNKEIPVYIELVLPQSESFSDYETFSKLFLNVSFLFQGY